MRGTQRIVRLVAERLKAERRGAERRGAEYLEANRHGVERLERGEEGGNLV